MGELPEGDAPAQEVGPPSTNPKHIVTVPCHTGLQVNLMRFSSAFHSPAASQPGAAVRQAAQADEPAPMPAPAVPAQELPEDLDARVRLIGEWQLGEAC